MSFSVFIGLLLLGSGCWIYTLHGKNDFLQKRLHRYSNLISKEDFEAELDTEIYHRQHQISVLDSKAEELQQELGYLERQVDLEKWGLYRFSEILMSPGQYADIFDDIQKRKNNMLSNGLVVQGPSWTLLTDYKSGDKLIKGLKELIIRLFNDKCETTISKLRSNNYEYSLKEIQKSFRSLNKTSALIGHEINEEYLNLVITELNTKHEYEVRSKEERELQKQYEAEEREQRKSEEVSRRAEENIRKVEEEKANYQNELNEIENRLKLNFQHKLKLAEQEKEYVELQAKKLREKIEELEEKVESEREIIKGQKHGYIFVVSNVGSFGEGIYRICKTKGDHETYVSTMSRYVPFPFQTNFKICSEEVDNITNQLHELFSHKRVNQMGLQRGFFRTTFIEISVAIDNVHKSAGVMKDIHVKEEFPYGSQH